MTVHPPKRFNTTGPCAPEKHYMLPVLPRLPDVGDMFDEEFYFILHAPRQSGNTTFVKFITNKINNDGKRYALNCSLATLRSVIDEDKVINRINSQINDAMRSSSVDIIRKNAYKYDNLPGMDAPDTKVKVLLNNLCLDLDKDLIIFFDEADLLTGPGLLTFLAQIRDGYNIRDKKINKFPISLALVGVRDIRDYIASKHPKYTGEHLASPFNIVAERMTLSNFTKDEINKLYLQHTEATRQIFDNNAIERAWYWSEGQPWLVNALARQIIEINFKNKKLDLIKASHIDDAAESLIKRRDTHIDSLLERLTEPKVIKVMDAVFAGTKSLVPINSDDRQYCQDIGLVVKEKNGTLKPANRIYKEVMSRVITDQIQFQLNENISKFKWNDGNIILMTDLLTDFQKFWRHDSRSFPFLKADFASQKFDESTYSFMLFAYLQKIVNSGAIVDREYAEGRGSVDISVKFNGKEYLIEVKLEYSYSSDSISQLAGYLDDAGENEGWLVVFDRNHAKSWEEKIYIKTIIYNSKTIHIFGC